MPVVGKRCGQTHMLKEILLETAPHIDGYKARSVYIPKPGKPGTDPETETDAAIVARTDRTLRFDFSDVFQEIFGTSYIRVEKSKKLPCVKIIYIEEEIYDKIESKLEGTLPELDKEPEHLPA